MIVGWMVVGLTAQLSTSQYMIIKKRLKKPLIVLGTGVGRLVKFNQSKPYFFAHMMCKNTATVIK